MRLHPRNKLQGILELSYNYFCVEIEEFIKENQIKISKSAQKLHKQAMQIMNESVDAMHSQFHASRILRDLDRFINSQQGVKIKGDLDYDILVLAISWHDTWKARHKPGNYFSLFWHQLFEGVGSKRMFESAALEIGLPPQTAKKVSYAIRKHSRFQFRSTNTLEAKILQDLDHLDEWSADRIKEAQKNYFIMRSQLHLWILKKYMQFQSRRDFHFKWATKEYKARKSLYFKQVEEFLEEI